MTHKVASAVILYTLSQALLVLGAKQAVCPISTVTSCFDIGPSSLAPTAGQDGCLTIYMPECVGCGCPTCRHTHVYTTTLDVFGGLLGVRPSGYTIKEIYQGMSRAPIYPRHTGVPLGFTVGPQTCTTCGFLPLTKTMTYPIGGRPVPFTLPSVPRPTKRVEPDPAPNAPMITAAPIRLVANHGQQHQQEEQDQDQDLDLHRNQDQDQDQYHHQDGAQALAQDAQEQWQEHPQHAQEQAEAQALAKAKPHNSPVVAAAGRTDGTGGGWMAIKLLMPLGVLLW